MTVFYKRFRKVSPQCNTIVRAMDNVLLPENAMKHRKALVSEEDFILETKSAKRVKKLLEHEPNTYDKHKYLSSSLRRRFCTSVLFIVTVLVLPSLFLVEAQESKLVYTQCTCKEMLSTYI